jgi:2-furoate---CoA ligase
MLDLGTSFVASVARDPKALAVVDGEVRLTYQAWYAKISAVVAGFDAMGLKPGDHLVTLLQNRWEAATLHWACQLAGIVITPINWRAKADEIDYAVENANAKAIAFEGVSAANVAESTAAQGLPRIVVAQPAGAGEIGFAELVAADAPLVAPRVDAEALSLMLYTSGTTAKPKGVPRRHRAERAAAVAHVAQNLYAKGERTLGVMPLYHTMGLRSLLAMSLIGGLFVCLPRFDIVGALELIEREKITNLYLVPTLYHDMVHHPAFAGADVRSVRKLGFAGAPMTDGLPPRPLRQPLRIVGDLHLHHQPGRRPQAGLGRAGWHQPDDPHREARRDRRQRHRRARRGGRDRRHRLRRRGFRGLLAAARSQRQGLPRRLVHDRRHRLCRRGR